MIEDNHTERLARIETHLEHVASRLEQLVTKAEFWPVKVLTLGMAGGILTAFLSSIIFKVMGAP